MIRLRNITAASVASFLLLVLAGAQDGGKEQDWQNRLTQVNREASEQFQSIAKTGSESGDWEAAQLFLSLAYFLDNFDPIIRGAWKSPGDGNNQLWDATKSALSKLREAKSPVRANDAIAVALKKLGCQTSDKESSQAPRPTFEVEDLNGFDFSIVDRDEHIKLVVRQRKGDPATRESLEKRKQALESLKALLSSERFKKAINAEVERVNGWLKDPKTFPGESKETEKRESPLQDVKTDKDSLYEKYISLKDESGKPGAKNVALSAEILGHLVLYLPDLLEGLRTANDYRRSTGLSPVGITALATYGCMLHSRYLFYETPESWATFDAHQESSKSPHFTALGSQTASRSVIATGSLPQSIHTWMTCFYHRISFLNPGLERIGLGRWKTGRIYNTCMDVRTGVGPDSRLTAVMFPGNGATDVPVRFDGEIPNPLPDGTEDAGYPITVSFFPSLGKLKVEQVKARLLEGADEVECWLSTPANPANRSEESNRDSICLIPKAPLKNATTYRVNIEAIVGTENKSWNWSFSTAK